MVARGKSSSPVETGNQTSLTGSLPLAKTIGIVLVEALAAIADAVPPIAMISATGRRTSSAANVFPPQLSYVRRWRRTAWLGW